MSAALCRDCLSWFDRPIFGRCSVCRGLRLLSHPELGQLSIAHLDCDAFYASVEKRDDPSLADRPVIVGGGRRGVVSTCCYIARIAGVRSAMPMFKALALCPDAAVLRPRMEVYAAVSARIRQKMAALTPLIEPLSLDEAFLDLSGTERMLGAAPAASMARLAREIERDLGISVSVGLSHNKYLAKLASDLDKPRGFSVVGRAETLSFLAPLPVERIWGVGATLASRLRADGFATIGALRAATLETLIARYGRIGRRLHELSRGIDTRRVNPNQPVKSVSAETTFDTDTGDASRLEGHLWRLAVQVSDRAKSKALAGATVTLKLRSARFTTLTRQTRLAQPTNLADPIYREAAALLARLRDSGPFRLIGVGLSALTPATEIEDAAALFEMPETGRARAEAATDEIRERYGRDAIIRGRALR